MIPTAIVARRADTGEPDTEEIRHLAEAAGVEVLGEVTQVRPEHPATQFGPGKVEELADRIEATSATGLVVDNPLTPTQALNLESATDVAVMDRHRVVLEIFAEQARTRRAQLQVELARLRYELPRIQELDDPQPMNIALEKGTRLNDVRDRIDELERQLGSLPAVDDQWRQRRREAGFDLVAIAGYTNAGKTTLLRRLADELSLADDGHGDLAESAAIEDRLFKTLETTTRRATLGGRNVLLTDTVGFLDDLPHWLVESFRGTLAEVEAADAIVLVGDLAQPVTELERKLETSRASIPADVPVVTVLNKADAVDDEAIAERLEAVRSLAPDPVVTSVREADSVASLESRIVDALPALETVELTLPLTDEAMSTVSWLHDEAVSVETSYADDSVTVTLSAKPPVVAQARSRVSSL